MPLAAPMFILDGALLIHVPPVVPALVRLAVVLMHMPNVPDIGVGRGCTVTVMEL